MELVNLTLSFVVLSSSIIKLQEVVCPVEVPVGRLMCINAFAA